MSALPPKTDIRPRDQDVCFGPQADSCTAPNSDLLDHLVGATEHGRWLGEADCFRGLEIDDQFVLGGSPHCATLANWSNGITRWPVRDHHQAREWLTEFQN
jgi:hypothetical protein